MPLAAGVLIAIGVQAADLGRYDIPNRPVVIRDPVDAVEMDGFAVEGRMEFSSYRWDIGSHSFKHLALAPQVVVSHQVNEWVDLRIGLMGAYLEDDRVEVGDGVLMSPDLFLLRPGAGARLWLNRDTPFSLYMDAQLHYYFIDGRDVSVSSSAASLSCGMGVGYHFDGGVAVLLGFVLETGLRDAEVKFNGKQEDLSLKSAGVGLGFQFAF